MSLYPVWQTRPVFVTSTFRDMHVERDYLRDHVFPVLEENYANGSITWNWWTFALV